MDSFLQSRSGERTDVSIDEYCKFEDFSYPLDEIYGEELPELGRLSDVEESAEEDEPSSWVPDKEDPLNSPSWGPTESHVPIPDDHSYSTNNNGYCIAPEEIEDHDSFAKHIEEIGAKRRKLSAGETEPHKVFIWKNSKMQSAKISFKNDDCTIVIAEEENISIPDTTTSVSLKYQLPATNKCDLDKLEADVKNNLAIRKALVSELALIGGVDWNVCLRNALRAIMSDDVRKLYNWAGRGGKTALRYYDLVGVVCDAVRVHFATITKSSLEEMMKRWLKNAPKKIQIPVTTATDNGN